MQQQHPLHHSLAAAARDCEYAKWPLLLSSSAVTPAKPTTMGARQQQQQLQQTASKQQARQRTSILLPTRPAAVFCCADGWPFSRMSVVGAGAGESESKCESLRAKRKNACPASKYGACEEKKAYLCLRADPWTDHYDTMMNRLLKTRLEALSHALCSAEHV